MSFVYCVTVILSATKNLLFTTVEINIVHNIGKKQILRCTQNDNGKIVPNEFIWTIY